MQTLQAGKEEEGEERQRKGEWEREGRVGEEREDVLERRVICTWLSDVLYTKCKIMSCKIHDHKRHFVMAVVTLLDLISMAVMSTKFQVSK